MDTPSMTTDSELFGLGPGFRVPVVGLGGSAGSIEALQKFFRGVPESSGMAYVVIVHVSPNHISSLPEILQRCTAMPVAQVNESVKVAEDHVYVIPPGKHLEMVDGCIRLLEASEAGEVMGATAIIQDITSRQKAMNDLQAARDELEDKVERRTAQLKAHADQLKLMAIEVTRAEQRERLRMARLLHDHVQQLLVSAKMHLESLHRSKSSIAPEDMSRAISILEDVLESSRSLAVDLSPPVLNEKLSLSLEWLADWVKRKHDLEVSTELDPEVDADGAEARSLVFLSVREILFNIVKHTDEKEAFVILEALGADKLQVRVRDHGLGFDVAAIKATNPSSSGHGLTSLRSRLEMIGGTLELISKQGEGLEILISVPRSATGGREA